MNEAKQAHLHAQLAALGQGGSLTKPALEAFKKNLSRDLDAERVEHSVRRDGNVLSVDVRSRDGDTYHGEVGLRAVSAALQEPEPEHEHEAEPERQSGEHE